MEVPGSLDEALKTIKVQAQEGLQRILNDNQEQWELKLQEKQEPLLRGINPHCIKLNVGGKKFVTTKALLTNIPNTKLEKIITGRYPLMFDHKKRIFIDRNGEFFGYVLDCLREGKVDLPPIGPLRKRIEAELTFFGILNNPNLKDQKDTKASGSVASGSITWKLSTQGSIQPSENKLGLQASSNSGFTIGDVEIKSGTHEWRFLIEKSSETTSGAESFGIFGVAEKNIWNNIKSGLEDYTCCYGFGTNGELCTGYMDSEDDGETLSTIPMGSEIKITFNPSAMQLKIQHKKQGGLPKTHTIEGVSNGVYYPFFFVNDAKITLLETVSKA